MYPSLLLIVLLLIAVRLIAVGLMMMIRKLCDGFFEDGVRTEAKRI